MSRLEDLAHRLLAQQAALNHAIELLGDLEGIVVELGLGKGRTFDHLRERLPGRDIYAFDRGLFCEVELAPPPAFRVFGDITETLPDFCRRFAGRAALIHSDIGTRHREADMPLVDFVAGHLPVLTRKGGVVASDRPMDGKEWVALSWAGEVTRFPYYVYRM